jgi:hypothetical protein
MKRLGFFIAESKEIKYAEGLCRSLFLNTKLGREYIISALLPSNAEYNVDIEGVENIYFDVPRFTQNIFYADKICAAAALEKASGEEGYIWLDVDSVFLKSFDVPNESDIYINPVDIRNIGDLFSTERSPMWRIILDFFKLNKEFAPIVTRISRENIYPYYNAGMVIVNRSKGLFSLASNAIEELLKDNRTISLINESQRNKIFFHQAVLSVAICQLYGSPTPIPEGVNYPLHLIEKDPAPPDLEDLISIRVEDYFDFHLIPKEWKAII